jgi:hypothetical protein
MVRKGVFIVVSFFALLAVGTGFFLCKPHTERVALNYVVPLDFFNGVKFEPKESGERSVIQRKTFLLRKTGLHVGDFIVLDDRSSGYLIIDASIQVHRKIEETTPLVAVSVYRAKLPEEIIDDPFK